MVNRQLLSVSIKHSSFLACILLTKTYCLSTEGDCDSRITIFRIMKRERNFSIYVQHFLFWILYWIIISLSAGLYDYDFSTIFLFTLSTLPLTIVTVYLFVYKILDPYYTKDRLRFILLSIVLLLCFVFTKRISVQYIQFPLLYAGGDYTFTFFDPYRLVTYALQIFTITGVFIGVKFYNEYRLEKVKVRTLKEEKRNIELQFLRSQLHPHFLFNTLNSLYYEVVNKTDNAGELLIKLSEILRYSLYESKDDLIPLEKEIRLINNYIDLEKSRYGDRLKVNLTIQGNESVLVPPLLCFSLIENAFKHGVATQLSNSEISIDINSSNELLRLSIDNPYEKTREKDEFNARKGIGLINVRKQLDLLYSQNYLLESSANNGRYLTKLEIKLSENA